MRQNVYAFVKAALLALKAGGQPVTRITEIGSYVVPSKTDPEGLLDLRKLAGDVFPEASYTGVDMRPGAGVDFVADVEHAALAEADVMICCDTLEHMRRPWLALANMHCTLAPGGVLIFAVPFTFQIHEHPHDYFRFTKDGMRSLLIDAGFEDLVVYSDPEESHFPHAVCGVAVKGDCMPARMHDLESAPWRYGVEQVMAVPSRPSALLSFDTPEQLDAAMTKVQRVLSSSDVLETIEERYRRLCDTPSDINEHLPVLRELVTLLPNDAAVVEMGTRGAVSTTALVAGMVELVKRPAAYWPACRRGTPTGHVRIPDLVVIDVDHRAVGNALLALGGYGVTVQGVVGSSLDADPVYCDLLFIDTLHTYAQLRAELFRHGDCVEKFIALHDTTTFGDVGEDGSTPGLKKAVAEFLEAHPHCWRVLVEHTNNNGLTVLERTR